MKKIICLILSMCLLIGLLPMNVFAIYVNGADNFIVPVETLYTVPDGYVGIYNAVGFDNIKNDTSGNYILMSNIDLSQYDNFTSIDNFSGVLDGNGYTLNGFKQSIASGTSQAYSGIIKTNTGIIKNLGVVDCSVTTTTTSGVAFGSSFVSINQGTIENCFVSGTLDVSVETPRISAIASICAYNKGIINYCHSLVDITAISGTGSATQFEVGGIVGENASTVTNCINSGIVNITNNNGTTFGAGVIGRTLTSFSDCGNMGNVFVKSVSGDVYCGGVTGIINSSSLTIMRCFNYGHIQGSSTNSNVYVGGIVGVLNAGEGTTTSEQNYNEGTVTAGTSSSSNAAAGGIAGVLQGYYHIANSYNNGAIRADSTGNNVSAGGIVGNLIQNISYGTVRNCYNTGVASSSNLGAQGGIVGTYSYSLVQIADTVGSSYSINNEALLGTSSPEVIIDDNCINYITSPNALTQQATFVGWDFENVWMMGDNDYPYPSLKNNLRIIEIVEEDTDFNVLIYRADSITSGANDIAVGIRAQYAFANDFGTCESLINDTVGLETAYESWTVIKDIVALVESGGLSLITGTLEEKDIYGAVILELLQCESNLKYVKNISDNTVLKYTNDISTQIGNVIKTRYNVTDEALYYNWLKEHQDEGAEIVGACMKTYGKDPSTDYKYYETSIMQVADATGYIKKVLATAGSLDNAVNQFVSYTMLLDLSESMKAIVSRMNDNCSLLENTPLKLALSEINNVVSAATEEELNRILIGDTIVSFGTNGVTWGYSKIWSNIYKDIKILYPWMAYAFALYHAGEWLIDQVIADEQYYRMHTILDVENLANKTLYQIYNDYKNLSTEINAAILLDMFEIKAKLVDMDNSAAYEYVDKALGMENWKDIISTNSESAHNMHFQINTAWLHSLLGEKPEVIKNYTGFWIEAWKECLNQYPDYYLDDAVDYEYFLDNRYSFGELIEVACPVNVYVYDENDNLVAYSTDETVYTSENISVIFENGVKHFYITDGKDYRIVCEGYDNGEMDIKLVNYVSGEINRITNFQNIPVSNLSSHTLNIDIDNQDQQLLYLENTSGNIDPSYDSNNVNTTKYNVFVENGYIDSDGQVSYDCKIEEGAVVELTPIVPEGYKFVKWSSTMGDGVFDDPKNEFCTFTMPSNDIVINAVVESKTVALPIISPNGGTFDENVSVTITCDTEGATIYYTTDGNNPTVLSSVYSDDILVTKTTTVKAIAVKDGLENSEIASAVFSINSSSISDVIISPATITIQKGDSQQFIATVNGTGTYDNTVTWNIEGANSEDTVISTLGQLTISISESSDTITVKAIANGDNTKIGTAIVSVTEPPHIHSYDKEVVATEYLKTAANCKYAAVYYKSCECGEADASTFENGEVDVDNHILRTFVYTDNSDGATHTKKYECCGIVVNEDEFHNYGNNSICDDCGFDRTSLHIHDWSDAWTINETHHWHECEAIDCPINDDSQKDGYGIHDGTATCLNKAECSHCAQKHGEKNPSNHALNTFVYTDNRDGLTHTKKHECCDIVVTTSESHAYGNDNICDDCGFDHSSLHVHDWFDIWANNETHHWHECYCGEKSNTNTHTASDWIVDIDATSTTNGSRHKECTICEYVILTEVIPATGSDFDWEYWYWIQMMIRNQEFTIEATTDEGGYITPDGESKVKYGNDLTYTITPDEGYEIVSVFVDGKDIGAVTEYTFKNVTKAHTISAVFAKLLWQNPFIDIFESDWFYDDVKFVNEEGLMIGVSTNEFGPAITLNRATIVTTLWRLAGSPIVEFDTDFTDLPDDWYTVAMKWAISEGIILGYGDGTCRPLAEITHEQVVAIFHRFMASRGYEDKPTMLSTQFVYSEWAENDVLWAIENNLFDGFGSDISDLTKTANRAEIAAYLHRLCELIGE